MFRKIFFLWYIPMLLSMNTSLFVVSLHTAKKKTKGKKLLKKKKTKGHEREGQVAKNSASIFFFFSFLLCFSLQSCDVCRLVHLCFFFVICQRFVCQHSHSVVETLWNFCGNKVLKKFKKKKKQLIV